MNTGDSVILLPRTLGHMAHNYLNYPENFEEQVGIQGQLVIGGKYVIETIDVEDSGRRVFRLTDTNGQHFSVFDESLLVDLSKATPASIKIGDKVKFNEEAPREVFREFMMYLSDFEMPGNIDDCHSVGDVVNGQYLVLGGTRENSNSIPFLAKYFLICEKQG